jgi:hypothetical protein
MGFLQDKQNLHAAVVRLGSSISLFLESLGFTRTACYFALKSRHQREGEGYKKLSWHVTLLAFAPYSEWRAIMQHLESHGYSQEIRTLLKEKQTPNPLAVSALLQNKDKWIAALLTDAHILANSKGQYLQTLHSEKVEPGAPATGNILLIMSLLETKIN